VLGPMIRSFPELSFRRWSSLLILGSLIATLQAAASIPATSTTLTVTSGGSVVTSATSGSIVTLTATVNAGPTVLTTGQVNFCDASAMLCTDVHLVGTAQLTKAGTATLKFRPGVGSHSYKAIFTGTKSDSASGSNIATLLVTGTVASTTSIAASGSPGNYQLTATVAGIGSAAPSGMVSFLDGSNSNAVLGTAMLGNSVSGLNFVNSWVGNTGPLSERPFVGDFNGDGIQDLIISGDENIFLQLGKGDGTFSSTAMNSAGQVALAAGDFNADGILDLVATSADAQSFAVTVWLGNGDGTFKPTGANSSIGPSGSIPGSVQVGDFNGDGILDLAALMNTGGNFNSLTVLLGNGDGTFSSAAASTNLQDSNGQMAVSDFNDDSILDVATANRNSNSVSILLGNGDGTFSPVVVSPATGSNPFDLVTGDVNGDGKLDLVVSNGGGSTLTVLLGNGNGTFTAGASSPQTGLFPGPITVGDFNGDHRADLFVLANQGVVSMFLGNGDGTFTLGSSLLEQNSPLSIAAGDFNDDGSSDIAVVSTYGYPGVTVQLSADQSATGMAAQIALPVATGTHQVVASYEGDTNFEPSISAETGLAAAVGTATIVVSPSANSVSYGTAETLNAKVTGDGFTPTGTVTFIDGIKQLGTGALNGSGIATFMSSSLAVGSHSITASYAGDTNYPTATSTAIPLTVNIGTPTISLTTSGLGLYGMSLTMTATLTGGGVSPTGTVTFFDGATALSTGAVSGGVAKYPTTALAVGSHTLTASYSGDSNYVGVTSAAVTVVTVPIGTAISTVTATPAAATITNQQMATVTVAVAGSSGQAMPTGIVTLASGSFSAMQTLVGGTVSISIPAGTLSDGANTLTATYSGDATYASSKANTTVTVSQVAIAGSAPSPVSPGASAKANISLSAGSTYSGEVNLSCTLTGSPAGAQNVPTCSLSPASVTIPLGGSGTSVLTVNTTASSTTAFVRPTKPSLWVLGDAGALLAGFLLLVTPIGRRRWMTMLVALWLIAAAGAIGCGGGSTRATHTTPATTAGNYIFTVAGTDSTNPNISASTSVTVPVQ